MVKLWKFNVSCGRMGTLSGIFTAGDEEVAEIFGKTIYFGEVLGKHSEVELEMKLEHFTILTDERSFINKFIALDCASGINPFNYLDYEDEDEDAKEE